MTDQKTDIGPKGQGPAHEAPPKKVSHYHEQKPPRLWSILYFGTIIWAIVIWVMYPVWPSFSKYTLGALGYSTRVELAETLDKQANERAPNKEWLLAADPETAAETDAVQYQAALDAGRSVFAVNCSPCHGRDAKGTQGFPNLSDTDWLWPSDFEEIEQTIRYGIRQPGNDETRAGDMPAFVRDGMLDREQALDAVHHVRTLSGLEADAARAGRGAQIFADNCTGCHGERGEGNAYMGAPNLTDDIWLYGNDIDTLYRTVSQGRSGVMPAWGHRFDDGTIRQLALYLKSLQQNTQGR